MEVNGLTNESDNVLPLDDRFWEHVSHLDFKIGIQLEEDRYLNILNALESIYTLIKEGEIEDAKFFITGLAATMLAAKYGKSQDVLNEMIVKILNENMDEELREILDEKKE
jgi:hypothetical protein